MDYDRITLGNVGQNLTYYRVDIFFVTIKSTDWLVKLIKVEVMGWIYVLEKIFFLGFKLLRLLFKEIISTLNYLKIVKGVHQIIHLHSEFRLRNF